ncbi:hypothetical protein QM297_28185 [Klebsiella pneumoniae]|uniref:hypothetical protein n=1 Tax=Klebsiella pneumoniae TaxID=573 RepID=UPI0029497ED5|nr:hypothetical protein [Klebsiella pneumoniae]MDV5580784.1 hypothetical protein [Klebsiella pneumoniae]
MSNHQLFARHAWLEQGWQQDVLISWNEAGTITAVAAGAVKPDGLPSVSWLLPGMPNLHSHAFQRVFAGLTGIAIILLTVSGAGGN